MALLFLHKFWMVPAPPFGVPEAGPGIPSGLAFRAGGRRPYGQYGRFQDLAQRPHGFSPRVTPYRRRPGEGYRLSGSLISVQFVLSLQIKRE